LIISITLLLPFVLLTIFLLFPSTSLIVSLIGPSFCFVLFYSSLNVESRLKPLRTGHKQDEAHLLFRDWHSRGSRTLASPKLVFRDAGRQVSPVTMSSPSPRTSAPLCLLLFIKGPPEGGRGAFRLETFALEGFGGLLFWRGFLGFGLVLLLWVFGCGKLLERKRIAKGKLLKRKVWLKGVDRKSAPRTCRP
jgi:hypothetical protein